ncbi:hypothetical protein HGB07_06890 [Candidatus Roizmanbacteria bacterium]|nr:hypothetical protein [Candidatus Roizmanbacteria bacterium]
MIIYQGDGQSYEISEKDKTKEVVELTKSYIGNKKSEDRYKVKLKNTPLKADRNRSKRVDVTHTLKENIVGKNGEILRRAGDKYNPLENVTMTNLIIIDGESADQIEWATEKEKEFSGNTKILIVSGSTKDVTEHYGIRVYRLRDDMQEFFKITHIPCTVSQDGKELVVNEYIF